MQIILTWQTVITAGAVVGALGGLTAVLFKFVHWVDRQKKQDKELVELRKHHDEDMRGLKEEQTLLTYGILACLKGLKEQGCNGPVTDAINKIERHLNQEAHK